MQKQGARVAKVNRAFYGVTVQCRKVIFRIPRCELEIANSRGLSSFDFPMLQIVLVRVTSSLGVYFLQVRTRGLLDASLIFQ